jgi:hypothetical protein
LQGNPSVPAGNLFDNVPQMNINNTNSDYNITYYYGLHSQEQPFTYTNTIIQPINYNRSCPERNGPLPEEEEKSGKMRTLASSLAQYDEWNAAFEYWLAQFKSVCAEDVGAYGHTPECEMIMDRVSYFSALKDNYFNGIISTRFNAWLEEKEEIGKESLYEDLRYLFAYRNHYTDNLSIAETYLAENNFSDAQSTLSTIYEKFALSEEQISELLSLQIYIRWLQQLDENGESIYKLPENEIEYLVNFVETWPAASHNGRGVVFANNILCGLYGICIEDAECRKQNAEGSNEVVNKDLWESVQSVSSVCKNQALENIILVPNPTTGQLTINNGQWTINNIEIFDIYGKKQLSIVNSQLSINEINISHLPAGLYFVKIKTEAGEVMKKVIKN